MDVTLIAGGKMMNWAFNPRYFHTVLKKKNSYVGGIFQDKKIK